VLPPHGCAVAVRASGALTPPVLSAQRLDGTVKLLGVERDEGVAGCRVTVIGIVSASHGKADDVVPGSAKREVISRR
jgi:hypothetical protein